VNAICHSKVQRNQTSYMSNRARSRIRRFSKDGHVSFAQSRSHDDLDNDSSLSLFLSSSLNVSIYCS